jgi:excisionase family DNA binding protein
VTTLEDARDAPRPSRGLMTRAAILDRYGFRLTMEQVAEVLKLSVGTVYNLASSGELRIATYKDSNRRFASYQAVADYLDLIDEEARQKAEEKSA